MIALDHRVVALIADRHAAQMGAHAHHDQNALLAADHAVLVGRRVALSLQVGVARHRILEIVQRHRLGGLDLLGRAVPDEHRIAAPFHGDRLALGDRREIDFDRGQRHDRGIGIHLVDERPQREAAPTTPTAPVAI